MTLDSVMVIILRYFTELVYGVVVKQLPRFQSLLLVFNVFHHNGSIYTYNITMKWKKKKRRKKRKKKHLTT